jgi:hypothetical protein
MIARVLSPGCIDYCIFKNMVKKRISGEEREKLVLDLYYNQNKTYREITKLAGAYPREIKAILKKADLWISRCNSNRLYYLINTMYEKGLSGIQDLLETKYERKPPEVWLRENPSILGDKHPNYERSRLSAIFVTNYLGLLAEEYLDHNEYNSYKHGLRSFVGKQTFQNQM